MTWDMFLELKETTLPCGLCIKRNTRRQEFFSLLRWTERVLHAWSKFMSNDKLTKCVKIKSWKDAFLNWDTYSSSEARTTDLPVHSHHSEVPWSTNWADQEQWSEWSEWKHPFRWNICYFKQCFHHALLQSQETVYSSNAQPLKRPGRQTLHSIMAFS